MRKLIALGLVALTGTGCGRSNLLLVEDCKKELIQVAVPETHQYLSIYSPGPIGEFVHVVNTIPPHIAAICPDNIIGTQIEVTN